MDDFLTYIMVGKLTSDGSPGPVVEFGQLMRAVEEIPEVAGQVIGSLGRDVVEVDGVTNGVHHWGKKQYSLKSIVNSLHNFIFYTICIT